MVETSPPPPDSHSGCAPVALRVDQNRVVWQRLCHQCTFLRRVEHEFGVLHAERIKDMLLLEPIERLA